MVAISQELADAQAKLAKLEKRRKSLKRKLYDADNAVHEANRQIRRLQLKAHVGEAVRNRVRHRAGDKWAWLDSATGTLVKVNRTRCEVDFGSAGKEHGSQIVSMPIENVTHVGDDRPDGFYL